MNLVNISKNTPCFGGELDGKYDVCKSCDNKTQDDKCDLFSKKENFQIGKFLPDTVNWKMMYEELKFEHDEANTYINYLCDANEELYGECHLLKEKIEKLQSEMNKNKNESERKTMNAFEENEQLKENMSRLLTAIDKLKGEDAVEYADLPDAEEYNYYILESDILFLNDIAEKKEKLELENSALKSRIKSLCCGEKCSDGYTEDDLEGKSDIDLLTESSFLYNELEKERSENERLLEENLELIEEISELKDEKDDLRKSLNKAIEKIKVGTNIENDYDSSSIEPFDDDDCCNIKAHEDYYSRYVDASEEAEKLFEENGKLKKIIRYMAGVI